MITKMVITDNLLGDVFLDKIEEGIQLSFCMADEPLLFPTFEAAMQAVEKAAKEMDQAFVEITANDFEAFCNAMDAEVEAV